MLDSGFTKLLVYIQVLPVQLLSDGIPVENSENLNLTIYSDPEIEVSIWVGLAMYPTLLIDMGVEKYIDYTYIMLTGCPSYIQNIN